MSLIYELNWLWEMLGIALVASAFSIICALLISKIAGKKASKKFILIIGIAGFVVAIIAVLGASRTIMPL
jgi:hypothetical protein